MLAISAKAVLIVVGPFVGLGRDYAGDFTLRKLLKGDGLHKNDRADDLFGVAAEALSRGSGGGSEFLILRAPNLYALPSGTARIERPGSGAQQREGHAKGGE